MNTNDTNEYECHLKRLPVICIHSHHSYNSYISILHYYLYAKGYSPNAGL